MSEKTLLPQSTPTLADFFGCTQASGGRKIRVFTSRVCRRSLARSPVGLRACRNGDSDGDGGNGGGGRRRRTRRRRTSAHTAVATAASSTSPPPMQQLASPLFNVHGAFAHSRSSPSSHAIARRWPSCRSGRTRRREPPPPPRRRQRQLRRLGSSRRQI